MMRHTLVKVAYLVLCFALPARPQADLIEAKSRKAVPDFSLADSKGTTIKLSNYRGKVVLLDFWSTWCGGCKVEIPWYMEFQKKYRDGGLSVVGVSVDDDGWKSVKPFLEEKQVNYPVVIGDWELAGRFCITSLPVALLIVRNGRIADFPGGKLDRDRFGVAIRNLFKERSGKE